MARAKVSPSPLSRLQGCRTIATGRDEACQVYCQTRVLEAPLRIRSEWALVLPVAATVPRARTVCSVLPLQPSAEPKSAIVLVVSTLKDKLPPLSHEATAT